MTDNSNEDHIINYPWIIYNCRRIKLKDLTKEQYMMLDCGLSIALLSKSINIKDKLECLCLQSIIQSQICSSWENEYLCYKINKYQGKTIKEKADDILIKQLKIMLLSTTALFHFITIYIDIPLDKEITVEDVNEMLIKKLSMLMTNYKPTKYEYYLIDNQQREELAQVITLYLSKLPIDYSNYHMMMLFEESLIIHDDNYWLVAIEIKSSLVQIEKCLKCNVIIEEHTRTKCPNCYLAFCHCSQCMEDNKYHDIYHTLFLNFFTDKPIQNSSFYGLNRDNNRVLNNDFILQSGLENYGNTCYINSSLQCLLHGTDLFKYIQHYMKNNKVNTSLLSSYISWVSNCIEEKTIKSDKKLLSFINHFKEKFPSFQNSQRQDVQEFIEALLNNMNEDLIPQKGDNLINDFYSLLSIYSPGESSNKNITELFYGKYKTIMKCQDIECWYSSTVYESFLMLQLAVPKREKNIISFIYVPLDRNQGIKQYDNCSIISTTKIKELKDMIKNDHENIMYEQLIAVKLSSKNIVQNVLEDHFNDWKKYNFNHSIIIYEKHLNEVINVYYYLDNPYKDKIKCFPYRMSLTYKTIQYPQFINMLKEELYILDPAVRGLNFKTRNQNEIDNNICSKNDIMIERLIPSNNLIFLMKKYNITPLSYNSNYSIEDVLIVQDILIDQFFILIIQNHQFSNNIPNINNSLPMALLLGDSSITITLKDCLANFQTYEIITKWSCPYCKKPSDLQKQIQLSSLPPNLIIQLKKFQQGIDLFPVKEYVDCPLNNLLLTDELGIKHGYNLYGVINHIKNACHPLGHYISICRINDSWYEFDDIKVKPIHSSNVMSKDAYLLFYKHK